MRISGNHNLTFGADFIVTYKKNENSIITPSDNGNLTLSTSSTVTTGNRWADFLTGRIAQYTQLNTQLKYYNRYKTFSSYIEDDWHVSKRLTLNLGFRAEIFGTYYNRYHLELSFDPRVYNPADAPQIDIDGSITGQAGALVPGIGSPFDGLVRCGVGKHPSRVFKGAPV